jgi:hypothetical protein
MFDSLVFESVGEQKTKNILARDLCCFFRLAINLELELVPAGYADPVAQRARDFSLGLRDPISDRQVSSVQSVVW